MYSKYKSRLLTHTIGWNKIYNAIPKARKVRQYRNKARIKTSRANSVYCISTPNVKVLFYNFTFFQFCCVTEPQFLLIVAFSAIWGLTQNYPLLKSLPRAKSHFVLEPWGQDSSLTTTFFVILFCNFFIDSLESLHHAPQFHSPPSPPYLPNIPAACAPTVK